VFIVTAHHNPKGNTDMSKFKVDVQAIRYNMGLEGNESWEDNLTVEIEVPDHAIADKGLFAWAETERQLGYEVDSMYSHNWATI
jgi:hypothetical protein